MNRSNKILQQERLIYKTPAESWIEALPVGNGRLGAMVYGGVNRDRYTLNEETVWAGNASVDRNNPNALEALPKVRELLFAGRNAEAAELAGKTMVSDPREPFSYQPLCEMIVECKTSFEYKDYLRELDLSSALAKTFYIRDHAKWSKTVFSSAPDDVLAIRYETDRPGQMNLYIGFDREQNASWEFLSDDTMKIAGFGDPDGIHFTALLKAVPEGGSVSKSTLKGRKRLMVNSADAVTLYFAAYTDYNHADPLGDCEKTVAAAAEKGYVALRENHIKDYRALYGRFAIDLSPSRNDIVFDRPGLSTSERLELIRDGHEDAAFYALYLNYNRYLLISSSRPGSLPSNLQGIWNDKMEAPWESDFHTNVNFQINYWGAERYGLSECHEPLFDWVKNIIIKTGSETAKKHYGANGWVLHHCTDIWGGASPIFGLLGIWPMGGAWLCRHFYEHYLYCRDKTFLKESYPVVKGAAEFMLDFLVEAPANTPCAGKLVTCPSHSPENRFLGPDGEYSWFTYASTMDIEIVLDLFKITGFMIDEIAKTDPGFESLFRQKIKEAASRLPEIKISKRTGGICEWIEDYEEFEPGHRHVSHLYAVHPAEQITAEKTPELAEAAKKTLERRLRFDYDGQGWSLGWIANLFARLKEGEKSYGCLAEIMRRHVLYNLFINAHGNPQVGDAQAGPAAILEMLAQYREDGTLLLLPALPKAFKTGSVKGFRLPNGAVLDMTWRNQKLRKATVTLKDETCAPDIALPGSSELKMVQSGNKISILG